MSLYEMVALVILLVLFILLTFSLLVNALDKEEEVHSLRSLGRDDPQVQKR